MAVDVGGVDDVPVDEKLNPAILIVQKAEHADRTGKGVEEPAEILVGRKAQMAAADLSGEVFGLKLLVGREQEQVAGAL